MAEEVDGAVRERLESELKCAESIPDWQDSSALPSDLGMHCVVVSLLVLFKAVCTTQLYQPSSDSLENLAPSEFLEEKMADVTVRQAVEYLGRYSEDSEDSSGMSGSDVFVTV
ncbi:hypothetical protein GE21DRAFT_1269427 [Neurospora crassa]|nr:hypothetical protein GE21DRAFT_1269427 [Neurospora crassa]